jgi:hypothetical protein
MTKNNGTNMQMPLPDPALMRLEKLVGKWELISEDGNTLTGGWRPEEGTESTDGNTDDAVMTRVK